MVDIHKMTIREIDEQFHLQMEFSDVPYILHKRITQEEITQRFGTIDNTAIPISDILEYLEENEKDVDKERLMVVNLNSYTQIKNFQSSAKKHMGAFGFEDKEIEKDWNKTRECVAEFCKEKDIVFAEQESVGGRYSTKVLSGRELIGKPLSEEERKQEKVSKRVIKILSNAALLNALLQTKDLEDQEEIFKVPGLGNHILQTMVYNSSLKMQLPPSKIRKLIETEKLDLYLEAHLLQLDGTEIKKAFEGVEKYIDMEKMCLYALSDIIKQIENADIIYYTKKDGKIGVSICETCIGTNAQLIPYLEGFLGEYDSILSNTKTELTIGDKTYTTAGTKQDMKKYIHGRYLSGFSIEEQISIFLENGVQEIGMHRSQLQYIQQYIVTERGVRNLKELNQMMDKQLLNERDVVKLYENRKLSLENIKEMRERLNLERQITPALIQNQIASLQNVKEEKRQYEEETVKRYVALYREIYITGKTEEEILEEAKKLLQRPESMKKKDDAKTPIEEHANLLRFGAISEETYIKLMERGIISVEDFVNQYQNDLIHINTIRTLKEEGVEFKGVDVEQQIMDNYMEIRDQENPDDKKLKKFIALYKVLQLSGLSEEENIDKADEFTMKIGVRIENDIKAKKQKREFGAKDRKQLYELGVIPIDTVVFWGERQELMELLKSKLLVPKDVRKLCENGRIPMRDFEEMMESPDMTIGQKLHLVNMVFSTHEVADIRQGLMARIKGLKSVVNSDRVTGKRGQKGDLKEQEGTMDKSNKDNRYIFDTAERYNAWIEADENVTMSLFDDGHVAIELPNIKGGIVVLEQLWKSKTVVENEEKIEQLVDKYGATGYVLTIEEYEKYKESFVSPDNRIERSNLIKLIGILPNLEEKGIGRKLIHSKNKYTTDVQKLLGIPNDLAEARTDSKRQQALTKLKNSKTYTLEEKARIIKMHKMWEEIRHNRDIYRE